MDPDGLVSRLPARLEGLVPGGTRATVLLALSYVATPWGFLVPAQVLQAPSLEAPAGCNGKGAVHRGLAEVSPCWSGCGETSSPCPA